MSVSPCINLYSYSGNYNDKDDLWSTMVNYDIYLSTKVTDVTILDEEKPVATSSPKAKRIEPNQITEMYHMQHYLWKLETRNYY